MADVQLEKGYTRIANDILVNLATIKLSPTQYRLILIIWRYTYGFKRKEHDLSLSFLSNATGIEKRNIQRELKALEDKKIISQNVKHGCYRKISFNKDYSHWTTVGEIAIGETNNSTVGETDNTTVGETNNQERNNIKKNIKKKDKEEDTTVERILVLLEKSKILDQKEITEFLKDDISDVIETFGFDNPEEMIIEAIKDSARGNGKTWKFVYKKLVAWKKQGIKSLSDLENLQEEEIENGKKIKKPRRGHVRPAGENKKPIFGDKVGRY